MDPRHLFVDERLGGHCVHCGGPPETRDHVPSRVFLDDPQPDDAPVVQSCLRCNQGFSLDEEYVACLIDCVLCGTATPSAVHRGKVRRALERNVNLVDRLEACKRADDGGSLVWRPEEERVRNVSLKLARGHLAYELGSPNLDEPSFIEVCPLITMSDEQRTEFESASAGSLRGWPEFGSRAFHRACGAHPYTDQPGPWTIIQSGRYRYSVDPDGVVVQIVLSEYLACRIRWE